MPYFTLARVEAAWPEKLTREEASNYLRERHGIRLGRQRLAVLAVNGAGPRYRKAGRQVIYERSELDRFANERLSAPASSGAGHFAMQEGAVRATKRGANSN